MSTQAAVCPCGSEKTYARCCEPVIRGNVKPESAEDLLRSRYSAFVKHEIEYIFDSHHPRTRNTLVRKEVEDWSRDSEWQSLKVLEKEAGEADDEKGTIVFHAEYTLDGKKNDHYEKSFFEKDAGDWKFVDAHGIQTGPFVRGEPKVGRNDPCPCGSGKKLKKCCAA